MISITWTLKNILKFSLKDGVGVDNWLFIHAARNNGHGYQAKYGDRHVQNAHREVEHFVKNGDVRDGLFIFLNDEHSCACKCR